VKPMVIVGASLAGLRAAQAIRSGGYEGDLVVVGEEQRPPYTRPPLSKELLAGDHDVARCEFDHSRLEATWRLGERAMQLDLGTREIELQSGERLPFSRVVLATGCRARTWSGVGAGLEGLFTLRTIDDALALKETLVPGARIAVVGAGFVGCEVAATATKLGCTVTMVDIAERTITPLGPMIGDRCRELHAGHGVELHLGVGVRGFVGDGRLAAIELDDGARIEADVAVVALGAIPNTDWLDGSGLSFERGGVLCDSTLTAVGDHDVLCAGDVASWPHPLAGGTVVRVEHWTNAAEQGAAAGRNALVEPDQRASYEAVPYFWTDQYDVKLQAVGFPALATEYQLLEEEPGRFVAVGSRDGNAVAAVAWNAPRRLTIYRRALDEQPPIDTIRTQMAADPKALGATIEASA
jgi:3-phenylpropionate/trans-cinnamate dioxygenase ferredoxin reductase subunit